MLSAALVEASASEEAAVTSGIPLLAVAAGASEAAVVTSDIMAPTGLAVLQVAVAVAAGRAVMAVLAAAAVLEIFPVRLDSLVAVHR
jgi:uncharacterized membrane protein YdcZ (DUF606 family)